MTSRERASLMLLGPGAAALVTAASSAGGWRAGVATAGALSMIGGVLLGLSDGQPTSAAVEPEYS